MSNSPGPFKSLYLIFFFFTLTNISVIGQVNYDNNSTTSLSNNTSNLIIPAFTAPAGNDRILVISISFTQATNVGLGTISFNGLNLTEVITANQTWPNVSAFSSLWYLPLGSGTAITSDVLVNFNTTTNYAMANAVTYNNVNQTAPIGNSQISTGTGTFTSITIASNPGDIVVDNLLSGGPFAITAGPGQVELENTLNESLHGNSYKQSIGSSSTMSWTKPNTSYTHVAMGINQCVACSSVPPVADYAVNILDDCVVGQVQFNDLSTNNPTSWNWTFPGGSPSTSTQQNPLVSYLNSGFYNATLVASNNSGSDSYTLPSDFQIQESPTASFTYQIINPSTVNFTNTSSANATSYFWDFGDGNTSNLADPIHTYASSGSFTVLLVATNSCGDDTQVEIITIDVDPVADFTSNTQQGCAPLVVNFIDQTTNVPTQWNWMFEGGSPQTSTIQNPTVQYLTPGVYDVGLTVGNGFATDMITKTDYITVDPLPVADFSFSINGPTVTFTDLSNFGDTWSWDFGDGNTGNMQNPIHTYGSSGTFSVTLIVTNNCGTDQITKDVIITLGPTASFTTAQSPQGCLPHVVDFMDTSGGNPSSWSWTFPGGIPATSMVQNPSITYFGTGSFDVTLEVTNTQGTSTTTETNYVIIDDTPTISFSHTNTNLTYSFMGSITNATSFVWDFGDGNSSMSSNPVHTYAMEGNYTVTLTATNNCGSVTEMQSIAAFLAPTAGFTQDQVTGCLPLTVQFMDNSSNNVTAWQWTFPGGNPATSTQQNPAVVYNTVGTYDVTLEVTAPNGMDAITTMDHITVIDVPVIDVDFNIVGNAVELINNTPGTTASWTVSDGAMYATNNPVHTFMENGNFTIDVVVTNACGSDMTTLDIGISVYPTAAFEGNVESGCAPLTVDFTSSSLLASSFDWTFEGGSPATSMDENPTVTYPNPGTYAVTLVAGNGFGSDTEVRTSYITVLAQPTAGYTFGQMGSTFNFTNTSTNGTSYAWDFGDSNTSTMMDPAHSYTAPGMYTVTLVVTNACGTMTYSEVIDVNFTTPGISAGFSVEEGCAPLVVQITDQSTNNPTSWLWNFPGGTPASSTDQNPQVTYNAPGLYSIEAVISNTDGSSTFNFVDQITVLDVPVSSFSSSEINGTVDFTNSSTGATTYLWDFGDGNTSTEENPTHTYSMTGDYTVTLTATNSCGDHVITMGVMVIVSSLEDLEKGLHFVVSPNPNNGNFDILFDTPQSRKIRLQLMDINGAVILQKSIDAINLRNIPISIPFSQNVLILKLCIEDQIITKKIISVSGN